MPEDARAHSHLWPGAPLALASAVLFGASAPFAKLLLAAVDPQVLAGLLYLGAGGGLSLALATRTAVGANRRRRRCGARIGRGSPPWWRSAAFSARSS